MLPIKRNNIRVEENVRGFGLIRVRICNRMPRQSTKPHNVYDWLRHVQVYFMFHFKRTINSCDFFHKLHVTMSFNGGENERKNVVGNVETISMVAIQFPANGHVNKGFV